MCKFKTVSQANNILRIVLEGEFLISGDTPSFDDLGNKIKAMPALKGIVFDTDELKAWDSSLLTFLLNISSFCKKEQIGFDKSALPGGIQRLLLLAEAVPERKGARKKKTNFSFLNKIGEYVVVSGVGIFDVMVFIGELCVAFSRLVTGKSSLNTATLFPILKDCTVDALPIVSLISCLVGLILAFVGAVQLVMFGAQIYVASLVGIAMIRVMGAVMAGVIMAGRTGAAFAAQLGTMEVNEEIDALKTLGISPIEFLVMPRVLALGVAMPLLCLYADLMGIIGGMLVGIFMLDLNVMEYYNMTRASVSLDSFWIGLFQSVVFGILVAMSGCLRGMQCKRSASAVGDAATSAVVTGIVSIVIATAVITLLCNVLGI